MHRTETAGAVSSVQRKARSSRLWFALALLLAWPQPAQAQVGFRDHPSATYFAAFGDFYDGDYRTAAGNFRAEVRGARKTVQARWIDSICYYAMLGECFYQMGQLPQAMDAYNSALQVYLANSNWMMQVNFAQAIKPGQSANISPWGVSTRQAVVPIYSPTLSITVGAFNANQVVQQGGVLGQPQIMLVNAREIVRCTALAIRRRRELLGVACEHDPLTKKLVSTLAARPGQRNNLSEAWIDVQLGLAQACENKIPQAMLTLQRGVVAMGQFDHPLTCVALLELGRLTLEAGDFPGAAALFAEASYSAAQFGDYGVLEEAFRYGLQAHLRANAAGVYPPLPRATVWANSHNLRQLKASLLVLTAENLAQLGETDRAGVALTQARATMARRNMLLGRLGARLNFITALVNYQKGLGQPGDVALAAALTYQQVGSQRIYELTIADQLATQNVVTSRAAKALYQTVLREPTTVDWATDPLETLSMLMHSHPGPYERWFGLVADTKSELELALEIADRARRHRFYSTLPLGGRALALEWLLEAPEAALDNQQIVERRDLLGRYPQYEQLSRRAAELKRALRAIPLDADDQAETRAKLVSDLGEVSLAQVTQLRALSLRREPSSFVFPPLRKTTDVRKALPQGHALLAFFHANRKLYAFLLTADRYAAWNPTAPAGITKQTAALLRELGQFDGNREMETAKLSDDGWKKQSGELLDAIMKGSGVNLGQNIDELVIVPDGELWYVPFEALHFAGKEGEDRKALAETVRIRYAPTVGLAVPDGRPHLRTPNLGVALGRLFPRDKPEVAEKAFEQLEKQVPSAVALAAPFPQPLPSWGVQLDQLVVLDDLANLVGGPYEWAPMQVAGSRGAGALAQWMALPLGGPDVLVLPGFHTAAEQGMKRLPAVPGNDVFLSVCGLLASGSRTVLLSRWRTGGASSVAATAEFLKEMPTLGPAAAWHKSLASVRQATVDAEREPRLRRMPAGQSLKAEHPFFWGGFLLIDSGTVDPDAAPAADPGADPQAAPPAKPAVAAKAGGAAGKPKSTPKDAAKQADPPASDMADDENDDPLPQLNLDPPEEAASVDESASDIADPAPDDPQ